MPPIIPVPVPDRVVDLIEDAFPEPICQSVYEAADARREVLSKRPRFTALLDDEDRADRESALGRLAFENKVLAAYNPRLILTSRGAA